jgi:hypothetical protein
MRLTTQSCGNATPPWLTTDLSPTTILSLIRNPPEVARCVAFALMS